MSAESLSIREALGVSDFTVYQVACHFLARYAAEIETHTAGESYHRAIQGLQGLPEELKLGIDFFTALGLNIVLKELKASGGLDNEQVAIF